MGYGAPTPADTPQEIRQFERILNSFNEKLNESRDISQGFYEKACSLRHLKLESDEVVKGTEKLKEPEGIINSLGMILERIDYLNQRNTEILKHLNTLM